MNQNSIFSVDEYLVSIGSPFFVEEYYFSAPSSLTPQSNGLSHEFSVDEYDPNEESTSARNVYQSSTSVSSGRQTNVGKQGSQSMSLSDAFTYIYVHVVIASIKVLLILAYYYRHICTCINSLKYMYSY